MRAEFPSSINPKVKFLDRYTVWDVIRVGVLAAVGWQLAGETGASGGILLGFVLTELKPGGKPLDRHAFDLVDRFANISTVRSTELSKFTDSSVTLADDTVLGIVEVSCQDIEYSSETAKEANRGTVQELLDKSDQRLEIYSRQRLVNLNSYTAAKSSTVITDHYILVKESGSSLKHNRYNVRTRCKEVEELLTAGGLQGEHLTGKQLKNAVKQLHTGKTRVSGNRFRTSYGEKSVCRMLYIDEYPERLPFGWLSEILNAETSGLVDVVQTTRPVSGDQRDWMDRMLARTESELSSSRNPSRETGLQQQKQDLEDLIDLEISGGTLVNYGVYIVARGETPGEARRTLEAVRSVLKRFRVESCEPRNLSQAVKRVSPFHNSRFYRTEIVPTFSAATGFSFATKGVIEPGGVLFGTYSNGTQVILDRFSWDAGHISVMGKTGSGKTYWTKLMLLRSYRNLEDVEIYVVDPKRRDYGDFVEALGAETVYVGDDPNVESDVVRYTVEDPSKDNTEELTEAVRQVYRQAVKTERKTLVVIDEVHRIITNGERINKDGIQAVSTLVRESRDRDVAATLVTQNANEFTRSNEGRNILRNVDCNLFFRHQSVENQVSDFFQLSEPQRIELRKLRTGNELGFSEALIQGPVDARLKIESSKEEHGLIENGALSDDTASSTQPAIVEGPGEGKKQRADGGHPSKKEAESENRPGFSKLFKTVFDASIGLFEYLLLSGFPVAVVLYREGLLKPGVQLDQLPLNSTLIDVLTVWMLIVLVAETAWILILSTDIWLAQYLQAGS